MKSIYLGDLFPVGSGCYKIEPDRHDIVLLIQFSLKCDIPEELSAEENNFSLSADSVGATYRVLNKEVNHARLTIKFKDFMSQTQGGKYINNRDLLFHFLEELAPKIQSPL